MKISQIVPDKSLCEGQFAAVVDTADYDPDNIEVMVRGVGRYSLTQLKNRIKQQLMDFADRMDSNPDYVERVLDQKTADAFMYMLRGYNEVVAELETPQNRRKRTIAGRSNKQESAHLESVIAAVRHIKEGVPFTESLFRYASDAYFETIHIGRMLNRAGLIENLDWESAEIFETSIGEKVRLRELGEVYLDAPFMIEDEDVNEDLRKWFKDKWVRVGTDGKIRGDCARGSDSEGKPKCLPQSKAHSMDKKDRASAARRKRREDPNPERRGAAKNVATKKESIAEDTNIPFNVCPSCGGGIIHESMMTEKKDACYHKVKARYKVWPSAYASGALVQCRKKGAKNWGKSKKESLAMKGSIDETAYEGDLEDSAPRVVIGVYGAKSKEFRKKFSSQAAQDRFFDHPDRSGNYEIHYVQKANESVSEAEYQGKDVELNKPKRGGSKKYYVYTKNPKTGKVMKISFGDPGLKTKSGNKDRAANFAARHNCEKKNDRTKAGYWACRLPRYGLVKGGKWW